MAEPDFNRFNPVSGEKKGTAGVASRRSQGEKRKNRVVAPLTRRLSIASAPDGPR